MSRRSSCGSGFFLREEQRTGAWTAQSSRSRRSAAAWRPGLRPRGTRESAYATRDASFSFRRGEPPQTCEPHSRQAQERRPSGLVDARDFRVALPCDARPCDEPPVRGAPVRSPSAIEPAVRGACWSWMPPWRCDPAATRLRDQALFAGRCEPSWTEMPVYFNCGTDRAMRKVFEVPRGARRILRGSALRFAEAATRRAANGASVGGRRRRRAAWGPTPCGRRSVAWRATARAVVASCVDEVRSGSTGC